MENTNDHDYYGYREEEEPVFTEEPEPDDTMMLDMFVQNVYDNIERHNRRSEGVPVQNIIHRYGSLGMTGSYFRGVSDLLRDFEDMLDIWSACGMYPPPNHNENGRFDDLVNGLAKRYTEFGPHDIVIGAGDHDRMSGRYLPAIYEQRTFWEEIANDIKHGQSELYAGRIAGWKAASGALCKAKIAEDMYEVSRGKRYDPSYMIPFDEVIPIFEALADVHGIGDIREDKFGKFEGYVMSGIRSEIKMLHDTGTVGPAFYERVRAIDHQYMCLGIDKHITWPFYVQHNGYHDYIDSVGWKIPVVFSDLDLVVMDTIADKCEITKRQPKALDNMEVSDDKSDECEY